MMSKKK